MRGGAKVIAECRGGAWRWGGAWSWGGATSILGAGPRQLETVVKRSLEAGTGGS